MSPESPSAQPSTDELAAQVPKKDAPLSELQNWMAKLILHDRTLEKSAALEAAARLHFCGNDRLSPAAQINVYRGQFWLRHTGVLIEHYPGLSRFLGQAAWEPIAESYLRREDCSVRALSHLGHRLPEHLQALPRWQEQDFCVDMARLEWAYQEAFTEANDAQLSLEALSALAPSDWERARFVLGSSLRMLRVRHAVHDARRRLRDPELPFDRAEALGERPLNLVIYRRDRNLWDKVLSESAYLLLEQFGQGQPLIAACEAVIAAHPPAEQVFDEELSDWFSLWGRLGWIVDVVVEPPS